MAKLKILEGTNIYSDGVLVGKLDLREGERSEKMVIIESAPLSNLKEVPQGPVEERILTRLSESSGDKKKVLLTLEGVFQRADSKNANGRVYPNSIWDSVLKPGSKQLTRASSGQMLGESDHPCLTKNDFRVLTEKGWRPFSDIRTGDRVWSRVDGLAVLSTVEGIVDAEYSGPVFTVSGKFIEAEFTPGHRFLLTNRYGEEVYETAGQISRNRSGFSHHSIPKTAQWTTEPTLFFSIPGVNDAGRCRNDVTEDLVLDARLFAGFLGLWLAEGSCSPDSVDNYGVFISQKNKWAREYIKRELLDRFPENLQWTEQKAGFFLSDARLYKYLKAIGNKYNKFIPEEVKSLDSQCLEDLIYWFNIGDGRILKSGERNFKESFANGGVRTVAGVRRSVFTTSERLIRDLHECLVKSGGSGTLSVQRPKDRLIKGRLIKAESSRPLYQLHLSTTGSISLDHRFLRIEERHHEGRIYCLQTEHGNFYMERNGKSFWTGNSDGLTLLSRVAAMTTDLRRSEDNPKEIVGRLVIFDTTKGRDLKAIYDGGGALGVSSRGQGSVVRVDGSDVVQEDYELDTFDVVHNPSTQGAYPSEVREVAVTTATAPVISETSTSGSPKNLDEAGYDEWPNAGWWNRKEELASKMSVSELHYARLDADKAARANPETEGKYRDEGSIYAREMARRHPGSEKSSVGESSKDVEVEKRPDRGGEQMWVVKKDGFPIGFVTKFKDSRTDINPYKAFRYVDGRGPGSPHGVAHRPLGVTYEGGFKAAVNAVVMDTVLQEALTEGGNCGACGVPLVAHGDDGKKGLCKDCAENSKVSNPVTLKKGDRVKFNRGFMLRNTGGSWPDLRGTVSSGPTGGRVKVDLDTDHMDDVRKANLVSAFGENPEFPVDAILKENTLTEPSTFVSKYPDGEAKWRKAKDAASEQYPGMKDKDPDRFYAITTGIFKKMVGESVRRPSTSAEVSRVLQEASLPPISNLTEATRATYRAYRDLVGADGPLRIHETTAISKFVREKVEADRKLEESSTSVRVVVTYSPDVTGKKVIEEFCLNSEAEVLRKVDEVLSKVNGGPALIEVDRSDRVYEECTRRFAPVLESERSRAAQAEKRAADRQSKITEMSARLAAAKDLVASLVKRVRAAESALAESKNREFEVSKELEEAKKEIRAASVRGVIEGVASAVSDKSEVATRVRSSRTIEEARGVVEKAKKEAESLFREPDSEYEERVSNALEANSKVLQEKSEGGKEESDIPPTVESDIVEYTKRLQSNMKKLGR